MHSVLSTDGPLAAQMDAELAALKDETAALRKTRDELGSLLAEIRREATSTSAILSELRAMAEAVAPLKSMKRDIARIQALVTAPRAVAIDDGLILAKLAFDELMLVVEQTDRLIGPHLIMNGIYEKALTSYFRSILAEVNTFVDVGANIGYYTTLFGKHLRDRGSVYAFEPSQRNFSLLERNAQINWIDKTNIVMERIAVSDADGQATLYQHNVKPGNTSLIDPKSGQDEHQISSYVVPTRSLDSYFTGKQVFVDVLKVDVEGYEFPVLRGAVETIKASKNIRLVIEWDPARWRRIGVSASDVITLVSDLGLFPSTLSSRGELIRLSQDELANVSYANLIFARAG